MPDEPSQSFFSNLKNLFNLSKNSVEAVRNIEPEDERIEELIENVLNIKDSIVKEIMIPKVNISFLIESDSLEAVYSVVNDTKHSRYPVLNSDKDKVTGILHVKDMLGSSEEKDFNLGSMLREAKHIPESQSVTSLLEDFKKDRAHLAIVLDEYGVISGLITIEDILEEIVGEIEDEFYEEKNNEIIKINDEEFIVTSTIEKEKFEDFFLCKLNCPDVETLGGFVLKEFGHLPKVGEKIQVGPLEMTVTSADQRKIKKITVRKVD
ncbi:MAG: CBS domain-containing protein [Gammaproteobacteria bacterium TMED112]|nr:MAG: CBS domain-containing protein [Gammaproteobacteria bacterium TMED112]|tara:strand:+ start:3335 stop:4129 length:795 start_codon:yes stop_codon:yes gene_type:complete